MTLLNAQTTLFSYFINNEVFKLEDFKKVFLTIGEEEVEEEIIKLALSELESKGIVSKISYRKKEYPTPFEAWVLNKPLQLYEQTLTISPITAKTISDIINAECERIGDSDNICNPLEICDKDIQNILKLYLTPTNPEDEEED